MKRSLALLVPLAAAITLGVSACGAEKSVTGGDAVAKAAAATTHTHGSRIAMTMVMSSDALPKDIHMSASGVMDQVTRKGRIALDLSDFANIEGSGLKASQLHVTEILDGTTFYMRIPFLDGKLPGDKKWIKLDLAKTGKALGFNLGQLMQPGQDPSQQLRYLRTVSDAKKVGSDTIRGVQTTHYHGVVDLNKYSELLPPGRRAAARTAVQRLMKLAGSSSYPIDAWVDSGGKLRRVHMKMNMDIPDSGDSLTLDLQEDLYDFGTNADVSPPSGSGVFDATKATSSAIQQSGLGG